MKSGLQFFVLDQIIARGPLVQRRGRWTAPDGAAIPERTVAALARRDLITIGDTGLGRAAAASPKGILWRMAKREAMAAQRKGNRRWAKRDKTARPG